MVGQALSLAQLSVLLMNLAGVAISLVPKVRNMGMAREGVQVAGMLPETGAMAANLSA